MTHDELLAEIKEAVRYSETSELFNQANGWVAGAKALRAVVELHKPDSTGGCNACEQWTNEGAYQLPYPCPTIQAIEKELKR